MNEREGACDSFLELTFLKTYRGLSEGPRFLIRFFVVLSGVFIFLQNMPADLGNTLRSLVSIGTVGLAHVFGFSAFIESGNIISVEGFRILIILECVAANYILIFAGAVITYPSSLKKKFYGLSIGTTLIIFLNLLRLVFLGWIGGHYPAYLNLAHSFLWEGSFLFFVTAMWVCWIRAGENAIVTTSGDANHKEKSGDSVWDSNVLSDNIWRRAVFGILLVAVILSTYSFVSWFYLKTLAGFSGFLLNIGGFEEGIIRVKGQALNILFVEKNMNWDLKIASIFDLYLFGALMICFSKARPVWKLAICFIAGLIIIMMLHTGAILATYMDLKDGVLNQSITTTLDIIIPICPFLVWLSLNISNIINRKNQFKSVMEVK